MKDTLTPDESGADFSIRYDEDGNVEVTMTGRVEDEIPEEIKPEPRYVFEKDDVVHFTIPSPDIEDDTEKLLEGDEEQLREAYEAAQFLERRLQDFSINLLGEFLIAVQRTEEYEDFGTMENFLERLFDREEFEVEVDVQTRRKGDNDGE